MPCVLHSRITSLASDQIGPSLKKNTESGLGLVLNPACPIYFGSIMYLAKHTFISIPFILFFFILIIDKKKAFLYQKIPKHFMDPFE